MKMVLSKTIAAVVALTITLAAEQSQAGADDRKKAEAAISASVGAALQGDAGSAVKMLAGVSPASLSGSDAKYRSCMMERFASGKAPTIASGNAWIDDLIRVYEKYWQASLTDPARRTAAEENLRSEIATVLGHPVASDDAFDAAENEFQDKAGRLGYHLLLGRTTPLRELMVWRKTTVERRSVRLPERTFPVTVHLLDDFVLRGWGYYATCGLRSAGGWATEEGLFAVVPSYKSLTDETFSVRFLAHETQHFADRQKFKGLDPWELEYRAKLTELALARQSQRSTRTLICENRSSSKDSAHAYANEQVVTELDRVFGHGRDLCASVFPPHAEVRSAAKRALSADTKRRVSGMMSQK